MEGATDPLVSEIELFTGGISCNELITIVCMCVSVSVCLCVCLCVCVHAHAHVCKVTEEKYYSISSYLPHISTFILQSPYAARVKVALTWSLAGFTIHAECLPAMTSQQIKREGSHEQYTAIKLGSHW